MHHLRAMIRAEIEKNEQQAIRVRIEREMLEHFLHLLDAAVPDNPPHPMPAQGRAPEPAANRVAMQNVGNEPASPGPRKSDSRAHLLAKKIEQMAKETRIRTNSGNPVRFEMGLGTSRFPMVRELLQERGGMDVVELQAALEQHFGAKIDKRILSVQLSQWRSKGLLRLKDRRWHLANSSEGHKGRAILEEDEGLPTAGTEEGILAPSTEEGGGELFPEPQDESAS